MTSAIMMCLLCVGGFTLLVSAVAGFVGSVYIPFCIERESASLAMQATLSRMVKTWAIFWVTLVFGGMFFSAGMSMLLNTQSRPPTDTVQTETK